MTCRIERNARLVLRTVYARRPASPAHHGRDGRSVPCAMATTTSTAIGVPRRRADGEGKVRGPRATRPTPVQGLLHARLVLAAEAHGRIPPSTARRRWASRASSPSSPRPTCRSPKGPPAGRANRWRARRSCTPGQPVALVVAESEAAAADGVDLVMVDIEPLEAALDLETAMAPGAARARSTSRPATAPSRRRPRGGGWRRRRRRRGGGPLRQRRRAPAHRRRRRGRGAGGRRRPALRGASARAGSIRATSSRRSPRRGWSPKAGS